MRARLRCLCSFRFFATQRSLSLLHKPPFRPFFLPLRPAATGISATSFNFPLWLSPWRTEALNGPLTTGNRPCADGLLPLVRPSFLSHSQFSGRHRARHSWKVFLGFVGGKGVHSFQWWRDHAFAGHVFSHQASSATVVALFWRGFGI